MLENRFMTVPVCWLIDINGLMYSFIAFYNLILKPALSKCLIKRTKIFFVTLSLDLSRGIIQNRRDGVVVRASASHRQTGGSFPFSSHTKRL